MWKCLETGGWRKWAAIAALFLGVWLGIRYLFGIALPFLLGGALARAAEPGVKFLQRKFRFPRALASGAAVSVALVLLLALAGLVCALGWRELSRLAQGIPEMTRQFGVGFGQLRDWALALVRRAPAGLAAALEQAVTEVFNGGSLVLEQVTDWALTATGRVVGRLPGGALTVGTVILSSYMISAQLPALRRKFRARKDWQRKCAQAWQSMKRVLGAWLTAQAKLIGISFLIVLGGFFLLRVEHPLTAALATAAVDAIPVLGTGTVLIPWALGCLLRGDVARAVGMAGLYLTAVLVRSALEPKLVGGQLGLNPLLTLLAIYAGYRLWGVGGMLLAPIAAVTAVQLAALGNRRLRD